MWIPANIILMDITVIGILCMVPTAFVNYKIYVAVRRHRNQIQALQVQQVAQNGEHDVEFCKYKKICSRYILHFCRVFVLLCATGLYLYAMTMSGQNTIVKHAVKGLTVYTYSVVFLNSSLNPVIYCWKMRHI